MQIYFKHEDINAPYSQIYIFQNLAFDRLIILAQIVLGTGITDSLEILKSSQFLNDFSFFLFIRIFEIGCSFMNLVGDYFIFFIFSMCRPLIKINSTMQVSQI